MDFFEHQDRARRKTSQLVVYFFLAVVLIIASVYLAIAAVLHYWGGYRSAPAETALPLWYPEVFAVVSVATLFIILIGTLYKIIELSGGGEVVARSLGGRPVSPNTRNLRERVLLNVVEEMALASGTPVPPVYLMDNESAINAFAAGTTPQNAVIGVTRGTIETLKRDELQGVIAHEFSHILNGDMRLNIRLIAILNGILLIAMIGYILMRTSGRRYFASSKKGGNPLPLIGLLLYMIGYVGVFFGHLIKSAVSRQREFLADASAVQFTRLPDGIAGALKKIGGLIQGSRLESERAEEASHMYFGNGLRDPFLQLLATHPPLVERIRRIDPKFDGTFERTLEVAYTADDIVDARTLSLSRGVPASAHAAAVAGAQAFAHDPQAAVATIGAPSRRHMEYATAVVASLPLEVASTVRDPLGAVGTVYALLLDEHESDVRRSQLEYLASKADPRADQETRRIAPFVPQVSAEARLPLVAMALPALVALSPRQRKAFHDDVQFLIKADREISLFEYAVHRLVQKRLVGRLVPQRFREPGMTTGPELESAIRGLLSTLAHWGTRDAAQARRAFQLGAEKLPGRGKRIQLLNRADCGLANLDNSLERLAAAPTIFKKSVIEASAACIAADGKATVDEAELLRVISDALDCPMPPLVDLHSP